VFSTQLFTVFLLSGCLVLTPIRWLCSGVIFGSMILGWALLAVSLANYVTAQLGVLWPESRELQVWGVGLGVLLSGYQTFYWRENPLRGLIFQDAVDEGPASRLQKAVSALGCVLKRSYRLVFQTADVIFCVGAPLLIMTSLVGWWLIDEISHRLILIYLLLISTIAIVGVYNNLVRMLALGYFDGYWLVDDNRLSYPFEAPMRVYNNIQTMLAEIGPDLWPLLSFSVLILCALYALLPSATKKSERSAARPKDESVRTDQRSRLTNGLAVGICLLAIPFGCLLLHTMVDLVNVYCFFAALLILLLDGLWRYEFEQEPALCGDCRHFLSNLFPSNLSLTHLWRR
jgi:hypothetical protein